MISRVIFHLWFMTFSQSSPNQLTQIAYSNFLEEEVLIISCRKVSNLLAYLLRNFSQQGNVSFKREFQVPTFCNIMVNVPYKVNIVPLDVHKYQNCDKLILEIQGTDDKVVEQSIDGNNIHIYSSSLKNENNVQLNITAPIKSNLQIVSEEDISVGTFNSDKLKLNSINGNINVSNHYGNKIYITTKTGNICINGPIQSSVFISRVLETGSITTGKLQCLKAHLKTNQGNISVPSCYSEESVFEASNGNLDLHNIHKYCNILLQKGQLRLTGFDGTLNANLGNVDTDIQFSRINKDSVVKITNGKLDLKIAEECQKSCVYEINAKNINLDPSMQEVEINNNLYTFSKDAVTTKTKVLLECTNSTIDISSASWKDLFEQKYNM